MDTPKTVVLSDGYNGNTSVFNAVPSEVRDGIAKVYLADPARSYMFRVIRIEDLQAAIEAQEKATK